MAGLITLTTDFGTRDGYVGAMKGVIARLAPDAHVVDLAHDIPRHDVAHAAWVVATCAGEFPLGTVHVVVVDPGVGGARGEVAVAAGGHLFVGPDNGVFAYVGAAPDAVHAIAAPEFRMPEAAVAPTFHGRDVFAPAAAALARGLPIAAAGPMSCLTGQLPWAPQAFGGRGVVVHVDGFGNLITNLRDAAIGATARISGRDVTVHRTYDDVDDGELVAYIGSARTLEIAIRGGSAAEALRIGRGTVVDAA